MKFWHLKEQVLDQTRTNKEDKANAFLTNNK